MNIYLRLFVAMGALLSVMVSSCSKNEILKENIILDDQKGKISNGEMSLTYGAEILARHMETQNLALSFDRLYNISGPWAQTARSMSYQTPVLQDAIALKGSTNVDINQSGKVYYVPEGEVYTGNMNINQAATIHILGEWRGRAGAVPANTVIEIAPTGVVEVANLSLNQQSSIVNNYGVFIYKEQNINGIINNFHRFELRANGETTINSNAKITNYCKWIFAKSVHVNSLLQNFGQIDFEVGVNINASGRLMLAQGSLIKIKGGNVDMAWGAKIVNEDPGFARINISKAALRNISGNAEISGNVDFNYEGAMDVAQIKSKIKFVNGAIVNGDVYIPGSKCVEGQGRGGCDYDNLQFTLLSTVKSPKVEEVKLSATDVKIDKGKAYVSYHTNDEVYGDKPYGAIRVFEVDNASTPKLLQEVAFQNAEFNGIDVNSDRVFAGGNNKDGARIVSSAMNNGLFSIDDFSGFQIVSYAGGSVKNSVVNRDKLLLAIGNSQGGLYEADAVNLFEFQEKLSLKGTKYIAKNKNKQAVLTVDGDGVPRLIISDLQSFDPKEYVFDDLKLEIRDGKNVISMDDEYVYMALSDRGVAKFSIETGEIVQHFEPKKYKTANGSKVFKENGNTNGLAWNECYLYLANGSDGIIVLNKNNFQVVGSFKLPESSNNVYAKENLLFVATGRGGLNIIRID